MRRVLAVGLMFGLVTAACSGTGGDRTSPSPTAEAPAPTSAADLAARPVTLEPYASCEALLEDVTGEALDRVGPGGFAVPDARIDRVPTDGALDEADAAGAAEAAPAPSTAVPGDAAAADHSGTNVQEAGVDEADLVKTDGSRVVVVHNGFLLVVEPSDGGPSVVGRLELGLAAQELFLGAGRALVVGTAPGVTVEQVLAQQQWSPGGPAAAPPPDPRGGTTPTTALVDVDLTDPTRPTVASTQYVEGTYLSARAVGDTARIVVTATPEPLVHDPTFDVWPASGESSADALERAHREEIERSTIDTWLPQRATVDADGSTSGGTLVPCERVSRPPGFSGLGTVSVLTADLGGPLGDLGAVSVLADGETVYASTDGLYVATSRWSDGSGPGGAAETADAETTDLHRFDIGGDGPATYESSGSVPGHLLDQFSMSEHDGHLRVATTAFTGSGTESFVTVLRLEDQALPRVGQVGDLGHPNEEIVGVRFLGDVGYVVTFEQTDPVYTLDLRDPAAPRAVGELEVLGYSAYLHPTGDGVLLGIGQDGTPDGTLVGTQLSLFDVSDPAEPRRVQHATVPGSWSEVEDEHRAFLWWPATSTAVVPVTGGEFTGVIVFRVTPDGIVELGRIAHEPPGGPSQVLTPAPCPPEADCVEPFPLTADLPILRSLVVGEELWTLSAVGVQAHDLDTLADRGFARF